MAAATQSTNPYLPVRLSRWPGNDPSGKPYVSHTTKMKWRREGKLRCIEFSGGVFVTEPWEDFLRRMASEEGQATAAE